MIILPRKLFLTADEKLCEITDVRQTRNYRPAGYPVPDAEAERYGLKAYLDETGWGPVAGVKDEPPEAKAVTEEEVEDKAVSGPKGKSTPEPAEAEAKPAVDKPEAKGEADEEDDEKSDEKPKPGLHVDRGTGRGRR